MVSFDSSASLGQITRALASAQKSNLHAPAYSRWINRPVGRLFAAMAFKAGLTPNVVTGISAVFSFSGIALLATARPTVSIGALVCLLLAIGYALDSADGQLARLRGGGSPAGEYLDHVVDCAKVLSFHLAICIAWTRWWSEGTASPALVPLGFTVIAGVWFFANILMDQLLRIAGATTLNTGLPAVRDERIVSVLSIAYDYGTLLLLTVTLGWSGVFRAIYTALLVLNAALLLVQLLRWYRRVARL